MLIALFAVFISLMNPAQAAPFTDTGDGTVKDSETGLVWMRCSMGQTWNGTTCTGTATAFDSNKIKAFQLNDGSDWRLPNEVELMDYWDSFWSNIDGSSVWITNGYMEFDGDLIITALGDGFTQKFNLILVKGKPTPPTPRPPVITPAEASPPPPAPPSISIFPGWNLVGNGVEAPIPVAAFGDPSKVLTVWKWVAAKSVWALFTPTMPDGGKAYAASKGYDFLTTINAGDGFWVNASMPLDIPLSSAGAVNSWSFKTSGSRALGSGWSLIAAGDRPTPDTFNLMFLTSPPTPWTRPANITSLWSWDNKKSAWYFWTPDIKSDDLSSYLASKGYLDFRTMPSATGINPSNQMPYDFSGTLSPTTGFWVNRP